MIKVRSMPLPLLIVSIVAIVYLCWQVTGLRFTNHDDIFFHLYSHLFSGKYLDFAGDTALRQARLQAFVNMPIILWASSMQNSAWLDLVNISVLMVLFVSVMYYFSVLVGRVNAVFLTTVVFITLPLHYYFAFPQGYPAMGAWSVACAFLSTGLFGRCLTDFHKAKYQSSIVLFTISLWGPEYNFILHPTLLWIMFLTSEKGGKSGRLFGSVLWPYAAGWVGSISAYLIFSVLSRDIGGDSYGRVSLSFDFTAFLKTIFVLQEKAFLPVSLIRGINLNVASLQGVPDIPSILSYTSLFSASLSDVLSVSAVFVTSAVAFMLLLRYQSTADKSIGSSALPLAAIALLPVVVVASSEHYQHIVLKGWLQGHLVSFYSHIGLSGLLLVGIVMARNETKSKVGSAVMKALCCFLLASFFTITCIYNNINRQVMMANKQKWDAVGTFVSFVKEIRPDLNSKPIYAPSLWSSNGVSSIPWSNPTDGLSYWSLYTEHVLDHRLAFLPDDFGLPADAVRVDYFSTPIGSPLILIEEQIEKGAIKRTAIARRRIAGSFNDRRDGSLLKFVKDEDWHCEAYCSVVLPGHHRLPSLGLSFNSYDVGPRNLIAQLLMPRRSGYGDPIMHKYRTLKQK